MEGILSKLFEFIVGGAIALGMLVLKIYHSRLTHIEKQIDKLMTEEQVRLLLNDKIEPLKERMDSIDGKLDKLIDLFLKGGRR